MIRGNLLQQLRSDRPLTDFHGVRGIGFTHNLRFGGTGSGPAGEGRGPGDVEADPCLVDRRGSRAAQFRLGSASPAIDTGGRGIRTGAGLDFFGNPRSYGDRWDIGAHEWSGDAGA